MLYFSLKHHNANSLCIFDTEKQSRATDIQTVQFRWHRRGTKTNGQVTRAAPSPASVSLFRPPAGARVYPFAHTAVLPGSHGEGLPSFSLPGSRSSPTSQRTQRRVTASASRGICPLRSTQNPRMQGSGRQLDPKQVTPKAWDSESR